MPNNVPLQRASFAGLCVFIALTGLAAPRPMDFLLQHVPSIPALVILHASITRFRFSDCSFLLMVSFMALHTLGARYYYSNVPYDEWSRQWLGWSITERFQFQRNHYDRLVHLAFGLLMTWPVQEYLERRELTTRRMAPWFALQFILAMSALYELCEWLVAILLAPEEAERYNGQQGDWWDAQKDMALAVLGGLVVVCGVIVVRARRSATLSAPSG
jgi:putative membrane protein